MGAICVVIPHGASHIEAPWWPTLDLPAQFAAPRALSISHIAISDIFTHRE